MPFDAMREMVFLTPEVKKRAILLNGNGSVTSDMDGDGAQIYHSAKERAELGPSRILSPFSSLRWQLQPR